MSRVQEIWTSRLSASLNTHSLTDSFSHVVQPNSTSPRLGPATKMVGVNPLKHRHFFVFCTIKTIEGPKSSNLFLATLMMDFIHPVKTLHGPIIFSNLCPENSFKQAKGCKKVHCCDGLEANSDKTYFISSKHHPLHCWKMNATLITFLFLIGF